MNQNVEPIIYAFIDGIIELWDAHTSEKSNITETD